MTANVAGTVRIVKEVPAIRISVFNGSNKADYYALIDSGADISIFPAIVARRIGIDLTTGKKDKGLGCGGNFDMFLFDDVLIAVGGDEFGIPVCFVENDQQPPLLGLKGLFDRYKVIIDKNKKEVELKPY